MQKRKLWSRRYEKPVYKKSVEDYSNTLPFSAALLLLMLVLLPLISCCCLCGVLCEKLPEQLWSVCCCSEQLRVSRSDESEACLRGENHRCLMLESEPCTAAIIEDCCDLLPCRSLNLLLLQPKSWSETQELASPSATFTWTSSSSKPR